MPVSWRRSPDRESASLFSPSRTSSTRASAPAIILEFSAPRWIQCAYNPPYADEYEEEEDAELEDLGGSWSCPSKPPELW